MTQFVIGLAGAAALLLLAVRMIRAGVEGAFLGYLRAGLLRMSGNPLKSALGGMAAAMVLQSSTAVAMLAASFTATGTLGAPIALAALLGADVGSAVVARVLLAPVGALAPFLLVVGVALFLRASSRPWRQAGRIITGLALVLVSLGMIREATAPLQDSAFIDMLVGYLDSDPVSAFVIGALLAWAMHSSVAAVIMFITFLAEGLLSAPTAIAMVLGANLGGAFIPFLLTMSAPAQTRAIVIGNLALRGGGAALALFAVSRFGADLSVLGATGPQQAINAHLVFNVTVALISLPFVSLVLGAISTITGDGEADAGRLRITALDESALSDPDQALVCASREALHMGESVHMMLTPALGLFRDWDDDVAARIEELENDVDKMHFETKLYIAKLQEGRLSAEQSRRAMDIAAIANNLEDAGDQIYTNLVALARRMRDEGLQFSEHGWRELTEFHENVVGNTQLALNILMTGDVDSARQLVGEKDRIRQTEQDLQVRHLARLRTGNTASIETSNLHQETVRALKQINTAFTFVAYPIAESAGDLLSSRLARGLKGGA